MAKPSLAYFVNLSLLSCPCQPVFPPPSITHFTYIPHPKGAVFMFAYATNAMRCVYTDVIAYIHTSISRLDGPGGAPGSC